MLWKQHHTRDLGQPLTDGPQSVERLVTPTAGRLAALAPLRLQGSTNINVQDAETPQSLLHSGSSRSHPELDYGMPGPASRPPRGLPGSQKLAPALHTPGSIIRCLAKTHFVMTSYGSLLQKCSGLQQQTSET